MNSKYKTLVKDTFIFAIGNMGSKLILFLLVPLYTSFLTTEQYGVAELIFTLSQLIVPFLTLAVNEAILRFGLINGIKQEDVIRNGAILFVISSIATVAITPLFSFYSTVDEWKWYLCVYIISVSATTVFTSYLKVKDKNKLFAGVSILQTLILAIMNVILLAVFHIGIRGYLIANIVSHFIAAIVTILGGGMLRDLKNSSYDKKLMKNMVLYSSPLIINGMSWWIIHSSDKIMVEMMISASALGLYTVATKIPSLINVIISIFTQAWGISSIKEIESSNDTKFYSNVFSVYSFLTFGAAVFLIAIIKPFMNIYVGSDFRDAWSYVPLLLISAAFSSISSYYGALFAALKKSVSNMVSTLVAAGVNIVINFVGIQLIGVWGAIAGTVSAYVIISLIRMIGVHRSMDIKIDYKLYISNAVIAFAMAILVSIDFYRIIVSVAGVALFALINIKQIKMLVTKTLSLMKNKSKGKTPNEIKK